MSETADAGPQRGEPPAEMTSLYLGFLKKGPTWQAEASDQIRQDQRGHLANFADLAQQGKLLLAGPTPDAGELRGICVFQADSAAEVRACMEPDPHLASGRLTMEIVPWLVDSQALLRPLLSESRSG